MKIFRNKMDAVLDFNKACANRERLWTDYKYMRDTLKLGSKAIAQLKEMEQSSALLKDVERVQQSLNRAFLPLYSKQSSHQRTLDSAMLETAATHLYLTLAERATLVDMVIRSQLAFDVMENGLCIEAETFVRDTLLKHHDKAEGADAKEDIAHFDNLVANQIECKDILHLRKIIQKIQN